MEQKDGETLMKKYQRGQCTEAEKALLEQWVMQLNEGDVDISQERIEKLGNEIYKNLPGPNGEPRSIKLWAVIAAVASVILIGISVLMFYPKIDTATIEHESVNDISPGGNKATLTLENGKTINLSADKAGVIIATDKITYNDSTSIATVNESEVPGLATITTPKGGEYQITLPDGTKVWLNSTTTLQFSANQMSWRGERKVRLESGEAYFQVAKDSKRPFVVTTRDQDVQVLGTIFNINAYADQPEIKTTLVEGSVKVAIHPGTSEALSTIIKPGEQAVFQNDKIAVKTVDLSLETAWKNGKIQFENVELKTVMSMLMRWYDIQVEYAYYPSDVRFSGNIARSKNISEILELIQSTGDVHYKIEGRKVLLMK